ncbi:hypothetical protein PAXRUDRAFT_21324 [Paxillus rubicundulus Ve08.2h10]|uniref:Unplaced genomic scaffold scaffold_5372, whole genome shotgun sequence n=1 Tax=Paxillus rubicundulus Ve08.2h10 TaxID=930991 RepID=A0A0D0CQE0_9AGAM|nr:hypothetical protein PAXRUDRAFT_21324 [Paxillus rubicundulus Ve08.2h10]
MSAVHRQELYDDHILDSNWKKLNTIVNSLLKKHKQALKGLEETESPYMELTHSLSEDQIRKWLDKELQALRLRGKHLDIYATNSEKGV